MADTFEWPCVVSDMFLWLGGSGGGGSGQSGKILSIVNKGCSNHSLRGERRKRRAFERSDGRE